MLLHYSGYVPAYHHKIIIILREILRNGVVAVIVFGFTSTYEIGAYYHQS